MFLRSTRGRPRSGYCTAHFVARGFQPSGWLAAERMARLKGSPYNVSRSARLRGVRGDSRAVQYVYGLYLRQGHVTVHAGRPGGRSEERRVGKECRDRWSTDEYKNKEIKVSWE